MTTQQVSPAPTTGATAPEQAPVARFSAEWFRDQAIRRAMVLVMLLILSYFSYRSARFGTLDNIQTIAVAAAPFAPSPSARPSSSSPEASTCRSARSSP